ncbi:MAG TPA: hypothetical protein VI136_18835 [Verrucomicrobiae bacterium]
MAAGAPLPLKGKVFISVSDKLQIPAIAKRFTDLGFEIVSTGRMMQFLEAFGLKVQKNFKLNEGRPNALDLQKNRELQLVINTPAGPTPRADQTEIRTTAVCSGVPTMTTLSSAKAALLGIAAEARQRRAEVA